MLRYSVGIFFYNYEDVSHKFVMRKLLEGIKRSKPKKNDLRIH